MKFRIKIIQEAILELLEKSVDNRFESIQVSNLRTDTLASHFLGTFATRTTRIASTAENVEGLIDLLAKRSCPALVQMTESDLLPMFRRWPTLDGGRIESNRPCIILLEDYSGTRASVALELYSLWSERFGLLLSQHPKLPQLFLIDRTRRFHEWTGEISEYFEVLPENEKVDEIRSGIEHFAMEEKMVKRIPFNKTSYLKEALQDLSNFHKVYFGEFQQESFACALHLNDTGIFLRRPYIKGESLDASLKKSTRKHLALLFLDACLEFGNAGLFPNDLRPWNLVFTESKCNLIDFPRNLNSDDDVDNLGNFLALLVTLDFICREEGEPFYDLLGSFKAIVCHHGGIYLFDSYERLRNAWLTPEEYRDMLVRFINNQISLSSILDKVFYGI
jgi:predicted Ser/Thr protein kinase